MTSVKQKSNKMFSIDGSEFSNVKTRPRIPCNELSVRSGLRIRMTRMAETFSCAADIENQPKITTEKSSYISIMTKRTQQLIADTKKESKINLQYSMDRADTSGPP